MGSLGSGFQRSSNYGSFRRRPTKEDKVIYAFEFEECVLRAYLSEPMVCKEHGQLQIGDIAPDAVSGGLGQRLKGFFQELTKRKLDGSKCYQFTADSRA